MIGHKTLYLYDMENPEKPIELAFQQRYGEIMTYKWYRKYILKVAVTMFKCQLLFKCQKNEM